MDQSFYDLAEILVCDPVASHRAATQSALYALGCRHIEIVANLRDFSDVLDHRPPDLALCEADVGAADLCRVIRDIRQSNQSYNPFNIIIVTAWRTNATLTAEISNSGADGLLLRPFSASLLDQRIQAHVLRRKPFIVTDDYVGPERRAEGSRPSSAVSLDPPNSLKAKIDGRSTPEEAIRCFDAELRAAYTKLRAARLQRSA
jgi:DNA-binding response OmpR family regulator